MRHFLTALGALLGAVVSYAIGFTAGIAVFVIAGVVLEVAFWILAVTYPGDNGSEQ